MISAEQRESVKLAVRGLYDAQKLRIQLELRIARLVRDGIMSADRAAGFFKIPFSRLEEAEKEMAKLVWHEVREWPIVSEWLIHVKGIGPRLSGLLVANIADPARFDTVSKLWAYAGLAVKEGRAQKRKTGQKANWNAELKVTAWKIGQSFVKAGGPYRELYDRYKARIIEREQNRGNTIHRQIAGKWVPISRDSLEDQETTANHVALENHKSDVGHSHDETPRDVASQWSPENQSAVASLLPDENQAGIASPPDAATPKSSASPEWTLGRINNMAMRYAVKRLLSHLWEVWRTMEGLPVRPHYAVQYLSHSHSDDPWSFIEKKRTTEDAA